MTTLMTEREFARRSAALAVAAPPTPAPAPSAPPPPNVPRIRVRPHPDNPAIASVYRITDGGVYRLGTCKRKGDRHFPTRVNADGKLAPATYHFPTLAAALRYMITGEPLDGTQIEHPTLSLTGNAPDSISLSAVLANARAGALFE